LKRQRDSKLKRWCNGEERKKEERSKEIKKKEVLIMAYKVYGRTVTGFRDTKKEAEKLRRRWKKDGVKGRIYIRKVV